MAEKLGICVATRDNLEHVVGMAQAARSKGMEVDVFFTGDGVYLTHEPRFKDVLGTGRITVCEVSYMERGLTDKEVPGLRYKDFVTQGRNAEMVEDCDRYLIL